MRLAGTYSFKHGKEEIARRYPDLLSEVNHAVARVAASEHRKGSGDGSAPSQRNPYDPQSLSRSLKKEFDSFSDWKTVRVACDAPNGGAFREFEFVKRKLAVEVQFKTDVHMICSMCAKMTIFHKLGYIDCGVEIVPVKAFSQEMSTGVSYFEQFVWDLDTRGVADIDIPVLILGVDC
ncbi:MAG TPA: BglII/BstYI family type II restriction endonuclease [Pirellulales bacterium]|jgi:hypothetical protein|nr:BglII/BstYI family type II restriction endonuclease [Pirellulales bacterium]